ncbi:MAG TPA: transcription-repair coupling factor, partial [Gammaproteobacteria bacterium]
MTKRLLKPALPANGQEIRWGQLYGAAPALAIAEAAQTDERPLLVICSSAQAAERLEGELAFLLTGTELPVFPFPDWETLPYDVFSPHQDIISRRLATLNRLETMKRGVVVATASALLSRLAPRTWLDGASFVMDRGEQLDTEAFSRRLESSGYSRVSQVMEHGEFAVRGSLIDIFPMGSPLPF